MSSLPSTTSALSSSLPKEASHGFFENAVLDALSPLKQGHLSLVLPSGAVVEFGDPATPLSAALVPGIHGRATLHVTHTDFFKDCVLSGDIGFAESYMKGHWDTPDLAAVIAWFILNIENAPTLSGSGRRTRFGLNLLRIGNRLNHLLRGNGRKGAAENIHAHYDLSNDFFSLFLDPSMMYSSALWKHPAQTLAEAQGEKNEALCQSLRLQPTDHVLEIGSGWGGWAIHAAKNYGCRVTSLTISKEQHAFAVARVRNAGLQNRVEIRLQDYRDVSGTFDKLVSIEMLEAVGHRYQNAFFETCSRVVKPHGLIALQFITCPDSRYPEFRKGVDFIQKHIFPGSLLLSLNRVNELLSRHGAFVQHSMHDFGPHYARTLLLWRQRFEEQLDRVRALGFDATFVRKWRYYLAYCEAAFAMRNISVVHTLHTRANNLSLT